MEMSVLVAFSGVGAALPSGVGLLGDPRCLHLDRQPRQHAAELLPLGDAQVSWRLGGVGGA